MLLIRLFCVSVLCFFMFPAMGQGGYSVTGRVVDFVSGEPIPYAAVAIWNTTKGTTTDSLGQFTIPNLKPDMYRLSVSNLGYTDYLSPEFQITTFGITMNVTLHPNSTVLEDVVVRAASPFRKTAESPVSMRVVGVQEIEKSPGANRDISKVVSSFPGVAGTTNGYRNDLLVRGGGPDENKFFLDGIEIPNINHFSTQGASGGPVGIIDADLIREVDFYSGAFPANRGDALSSVMDFKLKDGNPDKQVFRATVGASEVALGGSGHIGKKTTYLFSVRQSYLQFLFKVLNLPFLPNFTDAQFKIKTRFSPRHELTILGLGALDYMSLNKNTDTLDESKQYLLGYLPEINQKTYTVGAVYKHLGVKNTQTLVVSNNFMNNTNVKYRNNDESSPDNLSLNYKSDEIETHFRFENTTDAGRFRINVGTNMDYAVYKNSTYQKTFTTKPMIHDYRTDMNMLRWGVFGSVGYISDNRRLTASAGLRVDANDLSTRMNDMFRQLSPRVSLSYNVGGDFYLNANVGRFYQLPSYTTMGFENNEGKLVNIESGMTYIRSDQVVAGVEYRLSNTSRITLEGFYKKYDQTPVSSFDSIPLASKGTDYGVMGAEAATSTGRGRAYGVELMFRVFGAGRFNMIASYTFFRSEYKDPRQGGYIPASWDNRHLLTLAGGYKLPRNWNIGAKLRVAGGAPYTPYNTDKSSLVVAWDAASQPYYDYSLYNSERLGVFTQLDLRVDKAFYFKGWMLNVYIDIQNILNIQYSNPDVYVSTGVIDPATASLPLDQQRYIMKYIGRKDGTILPTLGIMFEF